MRGRCVRLVLDHLAFIIIYIVRNGRSKLVSFFILEDFLNLVASAFFKAPEHLLFFIFQFELCDTV